MASPDLSKLSGEDLDALYEAVRRAPLAISRLAESLPRARLIFALTALAESGLLEVRVDDQNIELRAPFAPSSENLKVRRPPAWDGKCERRRRLRASPKTVPVRGPRASDTFEHELELRYLSEELGIDEKTLRRNLASIGTRHARGRPRGKIR